MALMRCFVVGICMMCLWQMVAFSAIHSRARTRYEKRPDVETHSQYGHGKQGHRLGCSDTKVDAVADAYLEHHL